jgi:hypothetical protein
MRNGTISLKTMAKISATCIKFLGDEKYIHSIIQKADTEETILET